MKKGLPERQPLFYFKGTSPVPFHLTNAIEILDRTPTVVESMLSGLSEAWTHSNNGENTWSPYDIVGHLIHGEKTDWIPRMHIILDASGDKRFQPFDRHAQFNDSKGKSLSALLAEFKSLRRDNLKILRRTPISDIELEMKGIHPAFGEVSLSQLLSTWVVHDLGHLAQLSRVMASQYRDDVGPWIEYLSILTRP